MSPVLSRHGGTWVGWGGTLEGDDVDTEAVLRDQCIDLGYRLKPVVLSEHERDQFYLGFSNEVIWPLFHSLDERCNFAPAYWETYQRVNQKFADVLKGTLADDSFLWVHDYHFMLLGEYLRYERVRNKIGFFLHIPFPALDTFLKLPWRFECLKALLSYDIIGFQALRDRRNFVHCVRAMLGDATVRGRGRLQTITASERSVKVGVFPISIDFSEFAGRAASPTVRERAENLREKAEGRQVILGVDRLDYTKGIQWRLRGFRRFLRQHPHFRSKVRFVQVVVPSRETIPSYQRLKEEIDELVGDINGEFTQEGWVPIHYVFRSLSRDELLAHYRSADVALVTPLNDGMNLVAKEYCAANVDEQGVLVLSEFAGAAAELQRGAILVNPYDVMGMADAIEQALSMPVDERQKRMSRLRRIVRQNNIHRWVDFFLGAAADNPGGSTPNHHVENFIPAEPPQQKDKPVQLMYTRHDDLRGNLESPSGDPARFPV